MRILFDSAVFPTAARSAYLVTRMRTGDSEYQGDGTICDIGVCPQPSFCGDANLDGSITAPDALLALKVAVGSVFCNIEICDYTGDVDITAADALAILKKAVGQPILPKCPGGEEP